MGKALGVIATLTAGVALAATGIGALALPGLAGSVSIFGVSSSTLLAVSAGLSVAANFLNRPKAQKPESATSGQKQQIAARVKATGRSRQHGYDVFYGNGTNGTAITVRAFVDGRADGIEQVYFNDDKVSIVGGVVQTLPSKAYQGGNVKAGYSLGTTPNTAFPAVISATGGKWTANHRGDGVVTGYYILNPEKDKYFLETYPQGDNIDMSVVGRWGLYFDPRDGATRWTENPVLHTLDYLVNVRGYDYAKRIAPALQFWINAANVCDENVPLKNGGTEKRYRACVTYSMASAEKEVLNTFLETFDGWMQERGDGAFVIYAGKVYTPTVTIGSDDIISNNVQNFVEKENQIDQVKVTYISAAHDYTEQECTPWGGENGATQIGTIDAQTPSFSQNRRLAKRIMARTNAPHRGTTRVGLRAKGKIRGQRYVNLVHEEGGHTFFSGIAEIQNVKRLFFGLGAEFEWIEADPTVDMWNPATEEGEPAAVENKVTPAPVGAPMIQNVDVVYASSTDDGTGTQLRTTVANPPSDAGIWYMRWKKTENSVWNEDQYTDIDDTAGVVLQTGFVPANSSIDVQVQYRTGLGRVSEWSDTYTVNTSTDLTPPGDATTITLTNWSDTMDLVTDQIARARTYRWRFYAQDGTTLVRTINTATRTVSYTSQQAAADGPLRAYVVKVAGVNSAGAGGETSTGVLTLAAPPKVTNVVATGGATNAEIDFDTQPGAAGYNVSYSTAQNFNPLTQGSTEVRYASPAYLQGLGAATFYVKVAAFDAWTNAPNLLSYSDEKSFVITTGGGGTGTGGGGGGGGTCPEVTTPILLSNAERNGPGATKPAGELIAGKDWVWTQHEDTMQWGAYPVEAVSVHDCEDMWFVPLGTGFRASGDHRVWLSGWVRAHDIGTRCPDSRVVKITITDAHTYISAGVLSHNIKSGYEVE